MDLKAKPEFSMNSLAPLPRSKMDTISQELSPCFFAVSTHQIPEVVIDLNTITVLSSPATGGLEQINFSIKQSAAINLTGPKESMIFDKKSEL